MTLTQDLGISFAVAEVIRYSAVSFFCFLLPFGFYDEYINDTTKSLSYLNVHLVNRLLRENRKSIPKYLSGKRLFKNVTLQILNFIPVSFPHIVWC